MFKEDQTTPENFKESSKQNKTRAKQAITRNLDTKLKIIWKFLN